MNLKSWKMSLFAGMAVLALMAPAFGALFSQNITPFLPGVNNMGNQDATIGANGTGKIYKESVTGILVAFGSAIVPNQLGTAKTFNNTGLAIKDLTTGVWRKSTSDQEMVGVPNFGYAGATLLIVYNPAAVH